MAQRSLFPELEKIINVLQADERQDLVILIIPSHDKRQKELTDREMWANTAMDLFADLFGGATAFKTFAGIYKAKNGKLLRDNPIMIESYVARSSLQNRKTLMELLRFAKRLGKETDQAAVGLVINSVFHEITDYRGV